MEITKVCEICGKEFVDTRNIAKYCSDECREIARNEQKVAHYQAQKEGRVRVATTKCHSETCHNYTLKKSNHCMGLLRVYEINCPFYKSKKQYEEEVRKGAK